MIFTPGKAQAQIADRLSPAGDWWSQAGPGHPDEGSLMTAPDREGIHGMSSSRSSWLADRQDDLGDPATATASVELCHCAPRSHHRSCWSAGSGGGRRSYSHPTRYQHVHDRAVSRATGAAPVHIRPRARKKLILWGILIDPGHRDRHAGQHPVTRAPRAPHGFQCLAVAQRASGVFAQVILETG